MLWKADRTLKLFLIEEGQARGTWTEELMRKSK